jgi:glycerol kinase
MASDNYVVSLDQGTTSCRTIIYNALGEVVCVNSEALPVSFPKDGWVEQDPKQIWSAQNKTLQLAIRDIDLKKVVGIGITNQRETIICWDRHSGEPLAPAIVWQCRRSAEICRRLKKQGLEKIIKEKTGLVLDPYFSATKILWLLENIPGLSNEVKNGHAVFGTVDSWLVYNLTKETEVRFVTEPSNASRTMLYSLEKNDWDDELLNIFGVKRENLAKIKKSSGEFGIAKQSGISIPITGILGDQQASLFGHSCFKANSVKCTFGTGAFLLVNKGQAVPHSDSGLLSTVAWDLNIDLKPVYALEGSVFIAGALIQWLRDKLGIISNSTETEQIGRSVNNSAGVVVIPAFVGLGAPYWDSGARGAILNLTRDSSRAHIVRASLEAIAHQVADLLDLNDLVGVGKLSIDGGMSENNLFCEILANITQKQIEVAKSKETTAYGAARCALLGSGQYNSMSELSNQKMEEDVITSQRSFSPSISKEEHINERKKWKIAIKRVQT